MASRTRSFAFILYPESCPENWRDILDNYHIMWAESPLHCFDVEPTGEVKKPHWHIALAFDSLKSLQQVDSIAKSVNGTYPIALNSLRGMIRYFAHLDNPEKYQYPVEQIVGHGGIDIADLLKVSASQRYSMIKDMMDYVAAEGLTEFYQLMDYAMEHKYETWFPLLCDNSAFIIDKYIKSNRMRENNIRRELGE